MINYKDAYILLQIECEIPYDDSDKGKKVFQTYFILKIVLNLLKI